MASLALKNLVHDKVRLAVTLVGIIFSVILSSIQLGLFVGFQAATASLVENSNADIWISSKNLVSVEDGSAFNESKLYQILSASQVKQATKNIVTFANWKKANGAIVGIQLVGFDLQSEMLSPWNITRGNLESLREPNAVIVDELYSEKLGVTELGQTVEIGGRKAKVVGFTNGIRTFTTSPAVFTSFKNAQDYFNLREDQLLYILVKAENGANLAQLKSDLQTRLPDNDVYTREELIGIQ